MDQILNICHSFVVTPFDIFKGIQSTKKRFKWSKTTTNQMHAFKTFFDLFIFIYLKQFIGVSDLDTSQKPSLYSKIYPSPSHSSFHSFYGWVTVCLLIDTTIYHQLYSPSTGISPACKMVWCFKCPAAKSGLHLVFSYETSQVTHMLSPHNAAQILSHPSTSWLVLVAELESNSSINIPTRQRDTVGLNRSKQNLKLKTRFSFFQADWE